MLIRFQIDHLKQMQASQLIGIDLEVYNHTDGPAMTFIRDDKIVGCGGIHRLWKGVGEAWLILGDDVFQYSVVSARHIVRLFKGMVTDFHRIQAHVLNGFDKGTQLAESIGFTHESLMKQYGPNKEDYHRYVILR